MKKTENTQSKIWKKHSGMKRWQKLVSVLGCMVVFVTVYALILPAITKETQYFCGQEAHTHEDGCYSVETRLICEAEEGEEHTHEESCYIEERNPVCGLAAHTHSRACLSDPEADTDAALWLAKLPEKTECWAENVAGVALSQLGYSESTENFRVLPDETEVGYTIYGAEVQKPYEGWNTAFALWCVKQAGIPTQLPDNYAELLEADPHAAEKAAVIFPVSENVERWMELLDAQGCYVFAAQGEPVPGDVVFLGGRCGIVTELTMGQDEEGNPTEEIVGFTAVLGDEENCVARCDIALSEGQVLGYGRIPQNPDAAPEEEQEVTEIPEDEQEETELPEEEQQETEIPEEEQEETELPEEEQEETEIPEEEQQETEIPEDEQEETELPEEEQEETELPEEEQEETELPEEEQEETELPEDEQEETELPEDEQEEAELPEEENVCTGSEVPAYLDTLTPEEWEAFLRQLEESIYGSDYGISLMSLEEDELEGEDGFLMPMAFGIMPMAERPTGVDLTPYMTKVVLKYHDYHEGSDGPDSVWYDLPTEPGATIPANAHIHIEVSYYGVDPAYLAENDNKIVYEPSALLTNLKARSDIKVANQVRGTVDASDGFVVLEYDAAWVQSIAQQNATDETGNMSVVYGSFYFEGELDLSMLDGEHGNQLNLGPITIDIPVQGDALARYGELNIDKQEPVLKEIGGNYYLEYTIRVNTGKYGMKDVKIVDTLAGSSYLTNTPYVGLTGTAAETGTGDASLGPVEGSSLDDFAHGTVQQTASRTMTWSIGDMAPNEERTLTYLVDLADDYIGIKHDSNNMIANGASVSSKGYPHGSDNVKYTENGTLNIEKGHQNVTLLSDGNYQVDYWIAVQAPASNGYTMTNVKVTDDFWERTPDIYENYIHYVTNSMNLYKSKNNAANPGYSNIGDAFTAAERTWSYTDGGKNLTPPATLSPDKGFTAYIGDLAPGERVYLQYSMILEKEALPLDNNVGIKNRAKVFDDRDKTGGGKEVNAWNHDVNPLNMTWDRKLAPGELLLAKQITMDPADRVLDGTNGLATMPNPGGFTANSGSFEYYVVVNESGQNGHWSLSSTTMNDQLGAGLKFTGYVRVDRYSRVNDPGRVQSLDSLLASGTAAETVWVYVEDLTKFNFTALNLGFAEGTDSYVLHYFAKKDYTGEGKIEVGNDFSINGPAYGPGGMVLHLSGVNVHQEVTLVGSANFKLSKEPWYYDANDKEFSYVNKEGQIVYPGALYWVLRIEGTMLKEGSLVQEVANKFPSNMMHIVRPGSLTGETVSYYDGGNKTAAARNPGEGSFVGFYYANMGKTAGQWNEVRSNYPTLQDALDSGEFKPVTTRYSVFTSVAAGKDKFELPDNGMRGVYGEELDVSRGYNYNYNLKVEEDTAIPADHCLYLLVKTEPYRLPAEGPGIQSQSYKNVASCENLADNPPKWHDTDTTTTLYGGTNGLLKEAGGFYQVKTIGGAQTFQKMTDNGWQTFNPTVGNDASQKSDFASAFLRVDKDFESAKLNKNSLSADQLSRSYKYTDGYYVSWVVTVNTTNQLSGSYDVIDTLPEGVQFVYARPYGMMNSGNNNDMHGSDNVFKFASTSPGYDIWPNKGTGGCPEDVFTYPKSDIEPGWTLHMSQSPLTTHTMTWNRIGIFYYTKANQVLFHFENLSKATKPVQLQIVCKVTDPNIYFEDVEFYNTATLYNKYGLQIDARSAPVTVRSPSLGKQDLANLNGTLESSILPYTIEINAERANMDADSNYISVPMVDSMSQNLAIDMDTLMLFKDPQISSVTKEPILTWSVGDRTGVKMTDVNGSILYKTKTTAGLDNQVPQPGIYLYNGYKLTTTDTGDPVDKLTNAQGAQLYYEKQNGSRVKATAAEYGGALYIYNSFVLTGMKGADTDVITYNASNVVTTNLIYSNALTVQKQNAQGQKLYLTAGGTETTQAEEDAAHPNTPIVYDVGVGAVLRYDEASNTIVRALTRVSTEPDRNADGSPTGRSNVLFHYLPDSTRLVASYTVTATFGSTATYDNKVYWSGYGESEGGNTATNDAHVNAGATSGVESHGAVQVTKFDGRDTSVRLAGAEFALFRAAYVLDEETNEPTIFDSKRGGAKVFPKFVVDTGTKQVEIKYYYDEALTMEVTDKSGLHHHYLTDAKGRVVLDAEYIDSLNRTVNPVTGNPYTSADEGVRPKVYEYAYNDVTGRWEQVYDSQGNPVLDDHVLGFGVTDETGVVTYGLVGSNQDRIHYNKIYCVVEAKAPAGYTLDTSEHFFVVPNENQNGTYDGAAKYLADGTTLDRTYVNYFARHDNNICHAQVASQDGWPANVHEVTKSRDFKLTYFLSVANYKGDVKVTKSFGGNAENHYIPGTYTFGIWPSTNTLGIDPIQSSTITFTEEDFGWYIQSDNQQHRYKTENGSWYEWIPKAAGADPFLSNEGRWVLCDKPQDAVYGILPGHEQAVVFTDLEYDREYYVYEMYDGAAIMNGDTIEMNGTTFTVTYSARYMNSQGQMVVDANKVIPRTDNSGLPVVPFVIGTNSVYEARVQKSFTDSLAEGAIAGIPGTYRFGIWKMPAAGEVDLTAPLQTAAITWSKGETTEVKEAVFTGLAPGSYVIYELDEKGVGIPENGLCTVDGKSFRVHYGTTGTVTVNPGSSLIPVTEVTNEVAYFTLPKTGGMGTDLFTYGGLALMSLACLGYFACVLLRRRREEGAA